MRVLTATARVAKLRISWSNGDGGRDEADECYQDSPNFSDSDGAEGAGDAGDYHGDGIGGHDRDGSDEARCYRHPHFRPGYQSNTQDCLMLYCALRGLVVRTGETSGCIHVPMIS